MKSNKTMLYRILSLRENRVIYKLITTVVLIVLLLIPTAMVEELINERQKLNSEATKEVSEKWAGKQLINGPVITIPVLYESREESGTQQWENNLYILPQTLHINGNLIPEKLSRGMFEVAVYQTNLSISGQYELNQSFDKNYLKEIKVNEAFLTIGLSDLRGIKEEVNLEWNHHEIKPLSGSRIPDLIPEGITFELPELNFENDEKIDFSCQLELQGSKNLSFIPTGSVTKVNLQSAWTSPSFNGKFLPDHRAVSDKGFEASWKVLQLNRGFPEVWTDNSTYDISDANFGIDLLLPVNNYQKSLRSAKYALLIISLSFLVFFLVELINKSKIHPFQYTLVGLSICLFYILLVSLTEHINFNTAYTIASLVVLIMIFFYSLTIFKTRKLSLLLTGILTALYSFLFVTLQLEDYALLMGSIGLVIVLAITMFVTRKINWYQANIKS